MGHFTLEFSLGNFRLGPKARGTGLKARAGAEGTDGQVPHFTLILTMLIKLFLCMTPLATMRMSQVLIIDNGP